MKNFFLIGFTLLTFNLVFAQKHNIVNASIALKDENYTEAKQYIDEAYQNPNTSDDPKMWMYRAKIYKNIAFSSGKSDLDPMSIFKATESHMKCMEPHPKKKNKIIIYKKWSEEDVRTSLIQCGYKLFNTGIDKYNAEDYDNAIKHYSAILEIFPFDVEGQLGKINVGTITYEMFRCSKAMNDINNSKKYLEKLISLNYNHSSIYIEMSNILQDEGNSIQALEYLSKGREKFTSDPAIINAEINLYIKLDRTEELIEKITEAIKRDTTNDIYYAIRANCYQSLNLVEKSILDYKSALLINPNNSDVLNNLASCYLTQTEPIINKMNKLGINQTTKYNAYKKEVHNLYRKALPHLEKYVDLNPEDEANKRVLKELSYKLDN